jgi:hypothetical protein
MRSGWYAGQRKEGGHGMELTSREAWTVLHGLLFGSVFLLAFAGGLAGLWSLRPELVTVAGVQERLRRLWAGVWAMAIIAWVTVVTGTYVVYPWYRASPPEGTEDLSDYPRSLLLSDPSTDLWHKFGMEWKEHIAWAAPILATAVAFIVTWYGRRLAHDNRLRLVTIALFVLAFAAAGIAGIFGAFITKSAPLQ